MPKVRTGIAGRTGQRPASGRGGRGAPGHPQGWRRSVVTRQSGDRRIPVGQLGRCAAAGRGAALDLRCSPHRAERHEARDEHRVRHGDQPAVVPLATCCRSACPGPGRPAASRTCPGADRRHLQPGRHRSRPGPAGDERRQLSSRPPGPQAAPRRAGGRSPRRRRVLCRAGSSRSTGTSALGGTRLPSTSATADWST